MVKARRPTQRQRDTSAIAAMKKRSGLNGSVADMMKERSGSEMRWWLCDKEHAGQTLVDRSRHWQELDNLRRSRWRRDLALYEGFSSYVQSQLETPVLFRLDLIESAVEMNIIESAVDSACERLLDPPPRPMVATSASDYKQRRRAMALSQALDGMFTDDAVALDQKMERMVKDGCCTGDGHLLITDDDRDVYFERILSQDVLVDPQDAVVGEASQLAIVRHIDKQVLKAKFPDRAEDIDKCAVERREDLGGDFSIDLVRVVEGWRLPLRGQLPNGRHIVAVDGPVALVDEDWNIECFPVVHFQWKPKSIGYFGKGIASILERLQESINDKREQIRDGEQTLGKTFILLPNGSQVKPEHVDDEVGTCISYEGPQPPTMMAPQCAPADVYNSLKEDWQKAYEIIGLSSQFASGTIPAQLTGSGRAQIVYHNIQAKRFAGAVRSVQRAYLHAARLIIHAWENINKRYPGELELEYVSGDGIEKFNYADVRVDFKQHRLKLAAQSSLATDAPGKIEMAQQLQQLGYFTNRSEMRQAIDFADLDSNNDVNDASRDLCSEQIDAIRQGEWPVAPLPMMNLQDAQAMAQAALMDAVRRKAPEDLQENLADYLSQIQRLIPPPLPPGGPLAPGAMPAQGPPQQ